MDDYWNRSIVGAHIIVFASITDLHDDPLCSGSRRYYCLSTCHDYYYAHACNHDYNGRTTYCDCSVHPCHHHNEANDDSHPKHHSKRSLRSQSFSAVFCCADVALHALALSSGWRISPEGLKDSCSSMRHGVRVELNADGLKNRVKSNLFMYSTVLSKLPNWMFKF